MIQSPFSSARGPYFRGVALTSILFAMGATLSVFGQTTPPTFSQIIVFGDSLSDVGNIRERMEDKFAISYPGGGYNYSDGRFTNSSDTNPDSDLYVGVWHEQLARTFLSLQEPSPSLLGGTNYAFGGATTLAGSSNRTVVSNPAPFTGGNFTVTIDNMGEQVDDYLRDEIVDPAALYVVWGGGNDLFDDESAANVAATSARVVALVNRLITAGAKYILVPNVPPLGSVPLYGDDRSQQDDLNRASADYRERLNADLDANALLYSTTNPPTVYRLDIWKSFVYFTSDPVRYGFTDMWNDAQGNSSANPDEYLFWDEIHPTTAAHFQIAREANQVLTGQIRPDAEAVNVSTRVAVGTGENVSIGGFIIRGSVAKKVILRGIGRSLAAEGVPNALNDPTLVLNDGAGNVIATNDNWQDTQRVEIEASMLAPEDEFESAMVQTLSPGSYTVILRDKNGASGVGLVEVYDGDPAADSTLANLSTRGAVGVDTDVMIGGLIIGSGESPLFAVRAIGPSLTSEGVANPLLDPTLEVFDSNGTRIGLNDDWKEGQPSGLKSVLLAPKDDREAAMIVPLATGNYTIVVRGKGTATGVALVEAYPIR